MIEPQEIQNRVDHNINRLYVKVRKDRNRISNEIMYLNKEMSIPLQVIADYVGISVASCSLYLNKYFKVKEEKRVKMLELIDYGTKKIEEDIMSNHDLTDNEKSVLEKIVDNGHSILYGRPVRKRVSAKTKHLLYKSNT